MTTYIWNIFHVTHFKNTRHAEMWQTHKICHVINNNKDASMLYPICDMQVLKQEFNSTSNKH